MVSRKFLGVAALAAAIPLALAGCSTSGTSPTQGATDGAQFDGTFTVYASLGVTGSLSSICSRYCAARRWPSWQLCTVSRL